MIVRHWHVEMALGEVIGKKKGIIVASFSLIRAVADFSLLV